MNRLEKDRKVSQKCDRSGKRHQNQKCLTPDTSYDSDFEYELTWPTIVNNKVRWVPYISLSPEPDIVDNFSNIVQLTDDDSSRRTDQKHCNVADRTRPSLARSKERYCPNRLEKYSRKSSSSSSSLSSNFQKRFQNGANMQICFMNETILDDNDNLQANESGTVTYDRPANGTGHDKNKAPLTLHQLQTNCKEALMNCQQDIFVRLQNEKKNRVSSPIEDMIRNSFDNLGLEFPANRKRITRQILTEISNMTYLQILFNDLRQQIDTLNETLVRLLIEKDTLSMKRDSLLVDIVDYEQHLKNIETNSDCTKKSDENKQALTKGQSEMVAVASASAATSAGSGYLLSATLKPRFEKLKNFVRI